ncbi:uncharacterized protein N7483_012990 [Penicillium malachiteum]|uniref:uncharacterized protein n=1 Tax=Penicillium malachiteum TaxID=1324776 RepID=UPI0025484C49|nr:uncharacterized protein N7483_012990 [Penicillium malachiteum]KAJ5715809.1 hypothetical protein N7483_012990 [Penicillium malachiteum]
MSASVEPPMLSENVTADIINPSTAYSPASKSQAERKFSTVTEDRSFIPATMRALYYSPASGPNTNTYPVRGSIPAREESSLSPTVRADSMAQRENSVIDPRTDSIAFTDSRADVPSPRTVPEPTSTATRNQKPGPAGSLVLDTDFPTPQPARHQYLLKVLTAAFCQDELRLAMALNPSKTTPQVPLHSVCATVITTPPQDEDRPLGPRYKIGDVVWGVLSYTRDGGAADFVIANENELALKPPNITATEAAALALPALTAWGAFFRVAGLDPDAAAHLNGDGANGDRQSGSGAKSGKGSGYSGYRGSGKSAPEQRGSLSRLSLGKGGFGFGGGSSSGSGSGSSIGHRFSLANLTGSKPEPSPNVSPGLSPSASPSATGSGSTGGTSTGRKLSMASLGSIAAASTRKLSLTSSGSSATTNGFRRKKPLRILVTNARDSEVGRVAVQLLRAEKIFPSSLPRPWICVTCTVAEETVLRGDWSVDEILVIPHLPTKDECDLGSMFRERRWDPVDIVLDCTGGEVFRQAHSKDVVRDSGAVLTAVDPKPVQEPATAYEQDMLKQRKRGLKSRFVPVVPDAAAMKRISELVEDRVLRGREEQVVDLNRAAKLLEGKAAGAAGSRRGGMMVVRINNVC